MFSSNAVTFAVIIIIIIMTCSYILCSLVSFLTLCFGAYGLFPWRPEPQASSGPSHLSKKDQSAQWCEPQAGEHHLPNPQPGLKYGPAHGSALTHTPKPHADPTLHVFDISRGHSKRLAVLPLVSDFCFL